MSRWWCIAESNWDIMSSSRSKWFRYHCKLYTTNTSHKAKPQTKQIINTSHQWPQQQLVLILPLVSDQLKNTPSIPIYVYVHQKTLDILRQTLWDLNQFAQILSLQLRKLYFNKVCKHFPSHPKSLLVLCYLVNFKQSTQSEIVSLSKCNDTKNWQ